MAGDLLFADLGEVVSAFPVEVSQGVGSLILVLKTLGVMAIFYVVYVIVMGVLTYRRIKKVDHLEKVALDIEKKLNLVNRKLDKVLKKK